MLGEAETDLRRRRLHGDPVPADAAAAHLVAAFPCRHERVRGLARDVPGEARDQDRRHHRRGEDEDGGAAEAPAGRHPVGLHRGDHHQVERRQIPGHRAGDRHRPAEGGGRRKLVGGGFFVRETDQTISKGIENLQDYILNIHGVPLRSKLQARRLVAQIELAPNHRVNRPLSSVSRSTSSPIFRFAFHAFITKALFTETHTMSSFLLALNSTAFSTNPRRCFCKHVGVNMSRTARMMTFLPRLDRRSILSSFMKVIHTVTVGDLPNRATGDANYDRTQSRAHDMLPRPIARHLTPSTHTTGAKPRALARRCTHDVCYMPIAPRDPCQA
ncbi:replication protein A 70 kDa DNA-binding subunit [Striga asiatica]|uniref:Replication protein A 70 kDa DNA-binding subunit n=1 Tax=Striga asiatica TaxID=4170 RepID=A0A5A7P1E2_STRAF|nr:replication protein A 70 kDa DNA-binding subunit [Striga asiatica]